MFPVTVLATARLRLEPFKESHIDGLYAMDADPEVMRYLGGRPETRDETLQWIERVKAHWARWGYSWWSFVELTSGEIVGAGCIQHMRKNAAEPDPTYPLEIGWRVRREKWRQGLAFEAALAMAEFAFDALAADLLCSVCRAENIASAAVMRKLGMRYRGIERWYEMELATYEITRDEWNERHALLRLRAAELPRAPKRS